jgi:ribosome maturation factor RimP
LEKWARGAHFLREDSKMTQVHEKERELHREVEETVESRLPDVEVVAVELGGPERLCVYIDHPNGVDHALCEQVTSALRGYLDRYRLDVSSPGLARPLRKPEHFAAAIGRKAALRTAVELEGRRRFRGEIVAAEEQQLRIATEEREFEVPYDAIVRGNLIDEGLEQR